MESRECTHRSCYDQDSTTTFRKWTRSHIQHNITRANAHPKAPRPTTACRPGPARMPPPAYIHSVPARYPFSPHNFIIRSPVIGNLLRGSPRPAAASRRPAPGPIAGPRHLPAAHRPGPAHRPPARSSFPARFTLFFRAFVGSFCLFIALLFLILHCFLGSYPVLP